MSKVSHSNSILLFNVREEWSLVIDHEIEDTVLVGEFEAGGVDGGVLSGGFWDEGEAVEGWEHGEFELDDVASWWGERYPVVPDVFRELDFVWLGIQLARLVDVTWTLHTTSFFTR